MKFPMTTRIPSPMTRKTRNRKMTLTQTRILHRTTSPTRNRILQTTSPTRNRMLRQMTGPIPNRILRQATEPIPNRILRQVTGLIRIRMKPALFPKLLFILSDMRSLTGPVLIATVPLR